MSASLIIVSFFIPPVAVVDASIIAAVGELAGFYALYLVGEAIYRGSDAKITKGDISVEINNPDEKDIDSDM